MDQIETPNNGCVHKPKRMHSPRCTGTGTCDTVGTPFSRLPVEIQEMIFSFVALFDPPLTGLRRRKPKSSRTPSDDDSWSDSEDGLCSARPSRDARANENVNGSLGFIKLSHVCRTWRALLLSMTSIWADNIGLLPLATVDMVSRAKSRPLTLTLTEFSRTRFNPTGIESAVDTSAVRAIRSTFIAGDHTSRCIQALLLTETHGSSGPPWHILESVDLSVVGPAFGLVDNITIPSLRSLHMSNFFAPFAANSLRRLSISFKDSQNRKKVLKMSKLLDLLRGCCLTLQELKLFHCVAPNLMPSPEQIHLPALRRLDVGGCSPTLLDTINDHLAYPSTCDVAFCALKDLGFPSGSTDEALVRALRVFSDEVKSRSGSYGFVFNTLRDETSFISVCALSSDSLTGKGDLFRSHPNVGSRKVYFERFRTYNNGVFDELSTILRKFSKRAWDLTIFENLQVLSVVHAAIDTKPNQYAMGRVLSKMQELRVLQWHGFNEETLSEVCRCGRKDDADKPFLPKIQVLRLSAGYPLAPPIRLDDLFVELWTRAMPGRRRDLICTATLPCLIVDGDVEFDKGLEEQQRTARRMKEKNMVGEVYWKE